MIRTMSIFQRNPFWLEDEVGLFAMLDLQDIDILPWNNVFV